MTSCNAQKSNIYCKNSKLLIDSNVTKRYTNLLIEQLKNGIYRTDFMSMIHSKNILDRFNFNKKPFEIINII